MRAVFENDGRPLKSGEFDASMMMIDETWTDHRMSADDPAIVDGLVRKFAAQVLDIRARFHAGEHGHTDPLGMIEERACEVADILLGHDDSYAPPEPKRARWLTWQLTALLPEETQHYGSAMVGLMMWTAAQTSMASAEIEKGGDERDVLTRLDRVLADVIDRLNSKP